MPLDYTEVTFDRPRKLRYRIADLRGLTAALGNITLLDLLNKLAGLDPNALVMAVRFGLLHEDPRLTPAKAEDLLQKHIDAEGSAVKVIEAIGEAMQATGLINLRSPANGAGAGEAGGRPAS